MRRDPDSDSFPPPPPPCTHQSGQQAELSADSLTDRTIEQTYKSLSHSFSPPLFLYLRLPNNDTVVHFLQHNNVSLLLSTRGRLAFAWQVRNYTKFMEVHLLPDNYSYKQAKMWNQWIICNIEKVPIVSWYVKHLCRVHLKDLARIGLSSTENSCFHFSINSLCFWYISWDEARSFFPPTVLSVFTIFPQITRRCCIYSKENHSALWWKKLNCLC